MDPEAIRDFARRDWAAAAASKAAYWAGRYRVEGWQAAWNAANGLLLDMRGARPGYPSADDRARDLDAHLRLRHRIDRVADALAGR
jgi:hypothetical protein